MLTKLHPNINNAKKYIDFIFVRKIKCRFVQTSSIANFITSYLNKKNSIVFKPEI